jgi:hypothetical protein
MLSVVVGLAVLIAVVVSLRSEERFVVESSHLERTPGGVRVVGTLLNRGAAAPQVQVEVTIVGEDGRAEKAEDIELRDVAEGERVPFSTALRPGNARAYSIYVNEGRNMYGN